MKYSLIPKKKTNNKILPEKTPETPQKTDFVTIPSFIYWKLTFTSKLNINCSIFVLHKQHFKQSSMMFLRLTATSIVRSLHFT